MTLIEDTKLEDGTCEAIIAKYHLLERRMTEPLDPQDYVAASKEFSELNPVVENIFKLKKAKEELAQLTVMLDEPGIDGEMVELVRSEKQGLSEYIAKLGQDIQLALIPKDKADDKNAILEVRAGTGGDEAALFAGDLFRMYQRYGEGHGWKINIISMSEGEVGGFKEIISEISGKGVFSRLRFESGVHRVQRVPDTESSGRIHTSAATVAVLPEADDIDINIGDGDLRIDVYRASGAGGQHVNTTDSAVRITHLPTGVAVAVQDERSQHKNKAKAMKVLRARLYDMERIRSDDQRAMTRKALVGSGDRSERIRTYNFPQGRVTDHRLNLTLYKLDQILQGELLDQIIDALLIDHKSKLLAAMS